jgi:hypothetical protein
MKNTKYGPMVIPRDPDSSLAQSGRIGQCRIGVLPKINLRAPVPAI